VASRVDAAFEARLRLFYEEFAPAKAELAGRAARQWHGKEDKLVKMLRRKYTEHADFIVAFFEDWAEPR
jgi:hypothetical protein